MNYDEEDKIRYPVGGSFFEPDYSPHPFDVMAIYALYQNVPIASITGDTDGNYGEQITLSASVSGGPPPPIPTDGLIPPKSSRTLPMLRPHPSRWTFHTYIQTSEFLRTMSC